MRTKSKLDTIKTTTPVVKTAAVITFNNAGLYSKVGRRKIANWLRHQANALETNGHLYSEKTMRCRYLYVEGGFSFRKNRGR